MILEDLFKEQKILLSPLGKSAMFKAIKDVFGSIDDGISEHKLVENVLQWDLPEEQCLQIIKLTSKYAKLWVFS